MIFNIFKLIKKIEELGIAPDKAREAAIMLTEQLEKDYQATIAANERWFPIFKDVPGRDKQKKGRKR